MDKRRVRNLLKLYLSLLFSWLYIPHLLVYLILKPKGLSQDLTVMAKKVNLDIPLQLVFIYLVHNDSYFRSLFYYRIGPVLSLLISWWRPGNKYLIISRSMKLGGGVEVLHAFSSILNAESIGENFSFRNCTTVGATAKGRPTIGNNVTVGVNVCIIGNIIIGDNVFIGAGSVVTKDIPSNSIAAGNPAKVIRTFVSQE